QLACRHKIDHASSVEHYGVMNNRPNTLAPKQENKLDLDSDKDKDSDEDSDAVLLKISFFLVLHFLLTSDSVQFLQEISGFAIEFIIFC
ncbi:5925_t:CDS:2, partial [Dentiscutata heterogama]